MPNLAIWILEDDADRRDQMRRLCERWRIRIEFFSTSLAMLERLADQRDLPSILSLDHDLNQSVAADDSASGMDVVDFLVDQEPFAHVIIHSSNDEAALRMNIRLAEQHWAVARVFPSQGTTWIDGSWIHEIEKTLSQIAAAVDVGPLLTWTEPLRYAVTAPTAILLGCMMKDRRIRLFEASPILEPLDGRFRGHAELVQHDAIDVQSAVGGFSLLVKSGKLFAFCRRSILNPELADHLLPMALVNAIIEEVALPMHEEFRCIS